MTQSFFIKAKNEDDAQDKAVQICANDSEMLMPHNMTIDVQSASDVKDDWFNDNN